MEKNLPKGQYVQSGNLPTADQFHSPFESLFETHITKSESI